jgi:hypothetical protein
MNKQPIIAAALVCALLPLGASAGTSSIPVKPGDIIGKWRSEKNKNKIIVIGLDAGSLTLQTPEYADWEKREASGTISFIRFQRKATQDDIRKAKRVEGSDPLPDEIVAKAADEVTESFYGTVNRESHWFRKECDLTLKGTWKGFIIDWKADTPDQYSVKDAKANENFTQIRYEWPDLKRTSLQGLRYSGSSLTYSDLYDYFHDRVATQVYGEFGAAIFKSIYSGVTGAVPAETVLGKFATSLLGKAGEQALKGETLNGKDVAEVIAGQALDKVLEGESDEPFQTFADALKGYVSGTSADKSSAAGATEISKATADSLEQYLRNQCRYQLVKLDPSGNVAGGLIVVDQLNDSASLWVALKAHGGQPARVVMGSAGGLTEEGNHYSSLSLQFWDMQ